MWNIVLIILGFFAIFGLTTYLSARIHVKYMVKAIDTEGTVFKELIKKFKNLEEIKDLEEIKNLKSIKKNIRLCKYLEILLFLITLIILIAIEVIIGNYNLYGLKLYKVLLIIYSIYNMIGVLSNEYKQIITSEYAFIFACILELKSVYDYNLNKIPFINKLEVYNSASNQIKFKNKKGNSGFDSAEKLVLETYIKNIRNSIKPDVEEEPKKNSNKPLHYEEREEGMHKIWEAKVEDNFKITIMEGKIGLHKPVYSVFAKRYDIKNGDKRGYIEIASHKGFDLSEAKEIGDKMKNIASKYVSPGPERTNFVKNLPASLNFKETRDNRFGFTTREINVDENCNIKIIKSDRKKQHSVFVKMHKQEHGITQGYIEVASHLGNTFSQAKTIAEKLYNQALSYKTPGIDGK